jgi:outer membrane receptor protein involved in Fe transport
MKNAVRARLLASTLLIGAVAGTTPAFAQIAPQGSPEATQDTAQDAAKPGAGDIIVTGSLIRSPNLVQSSPVASISSSEVELRQSNTAEEILRDIPGVVPDIGAQVNNGNTGASFVNLRGLGANRNLVLIDGARIVPADLVGAVDLNNIPLALIERTDVLTGGASTTYGADAVAGVVNFVTKQNFSGVEATVSNQITERGDANTYRADITVGHNFGGDRGNAVLSFSYQHADPLYQGKRPYSVNAIDQTDGSNGGSFTTAPAILDGPILSGQIDPTTGAVQDGNYDNLYNYAPTNIFQTPFKRYNVYGAAHYDVTPDVEVYTQGLWSKNSVGTILAPSGTFGNTYAIPISNPFLSDALRTQLCNAGGISAAACTVAAGVTNPTAAGYQTVDESVYRRFVEAGNRYATYTTELFNVRGGARGSITSNIKWDIYGAYGESKNTNRQTGQGLNSRVEQALQAVNTTTCVDPSNGCVPINLFGGVGSLTQDSINFINVETESAVKTTLGQVHGEVNGDVGVSSPWASAPISFAVGGEYRKYTASTTSDIYNQTPGEVLGNGAANPDTFGKYDVYEGFAELNVPIVQDRPFFRSLNLELGARESHYSTAGSAFTWKAGGGWEPFQGLKLRGNYQKAVRAPNISELFSPAVTGLDSLSADPCAGAAPTANANLRAVCLAQGAPAASIGSILNPSANQPNVTTSGNLNLGVETARTYTFGAVIQPDRIRGLSFTADYYHIKVTGAISSPTPGDVIAACFANITATSATDPACTGIRRNPTTGSLSGSSADTPGLPEPLSNLGTLLTDGIDLTANYRRDLGVGIINLSFTGNWTNRSKFQATPTSVDRECVGYYSVNCASIQPKFSWNQRTTFTIDKVDLSLLWRHVGAVNYEPLQLADDVAQDAAPLAEYQHIKAYNIIDLATRIQATEHMEFVLTVSNLLDKQPPIVGSTIGSTAFNSGNTYPSTYDVLGRRYAVSVKLDF